MGKIKMNKIVVIIPYFGEFKPSISLFLESCNRNKDIDWLIFTDCKIPKGITLNNNIVWNFTTLKEVRELAEEKLECKISLEKAYKLCDLKPMYGLVFEDYITHYEYWGFGDTDVIYGNLMAYLDKICYQNYDKINWMGHLCFLRNAPFINSIAMKEVPGTISPRTVLELSENQGYDERDFNKKCLSCDLRLYNNEWAADIDIFYWRMRCTDLKTFHHLLDTREIKYAPKNYPKQLFALVYGAVYRYYIDKETVKKDEFAYIHFRKEAPIHFDDFSNATFIVSRDGFYKIKKEQLESLNDLRATIEKYNNQETPFQEYKNYIIQYYRKITGKRGW